ncbi:hypothetical protein ABW19_dt0207407 [Dactylella cylindrospora]|nr:hypothetical protein ABW19_dt0207407 [Dactylella cylindrospora]
MAPKNKKKKPASNPARGFATTSMPSKAKIQQEEEEKARLAAEEEEKVQAEAAAAAAREEGGRLSDIAQAKPDDGQLTPEEYAAQLEENELQEFLEKNGEKVLREAKRVATKFESERRTLRAVNNPGCTPFTAGSWLEEKDIENILQRGRGDLNARLTVNPPDETAYTLEIWKLYTTMTELGFKEMHTKEVITMGISSPEDAIEYLVLSYPEEELPTFIAGGVVKAPPNVQLLAQTALGQPPAQETAVEPQEIQTPETLSEAKNELTQPPVPEFIQEDVSSESEMEDNNDPAILVPQYLRYMRKLSKITGVWAAESSKKSKKKNSTSVSVSSVALTKERSVQVATLKLKIERLKADPLFDFAQAAELWEMEVQEERQTAISRARSLKRKNTAIGPKQQNTDSSRPGSRSRPSSAHGDSGDEGGMRRSMSKMKLTRSSSRASSRASASSMDGGAFGTIFNDDLDNEVDARFQNTSITVQDFGKPAEATPSSKKVLDEVVTGRYPTAKVAFRDVSGSSSSFRSEVYITWSLSGQLPNNFPAEIEELDENGEIRDVPYSIHTLRSHDEMSVTTRFRMVKISCTSRVQADFYIATIALFRLFQDEKVYLRLNGFWRSFWANLVDEVKIDKEKQDKQILAWVRNTAEDIVQGAPGIEENAKLDSGIEGGEGKKQFYEPLEFMTSTQIQTIFHAKISTPLYHHMLLGRMNLPIWNYRDQLMHAIEENQVTISCRIFVTEPRRISAISLAKRVCEELGENSGDLGTNRSLVGYSIRLEAKFSSQTRLIYATTGIVMRLLERGNNLREMTHLILDEVHERSIESDFLLLVLRKLLAVRKDLKVILMSATVDANKFSEYLDGAPIFQIPGRTFPVQTFYLEDAVETTDFILSDDSVRRNRRQDDEYSFDEVEETGPMSTSNYEAYSVQTRKTMARFDEWTINYDLIVQLIIQVATNPHYAPYSQAILVFLPGMNEIRRLHSALLGDPNFQQGWELHALHSAIATEEQERAFFIPPAGYRKVVIATNIAETGITIPDITCVIDTCKSKEMRFDEKKQLSRLIETFVSKANAKQRRGRAGRVQEGLCFHLVTKERFNNYFAEQQVPEMLRLSLQDLVLRIKICNLGGIEDTLSLALDPPTSKNVNRAIDSLLEVKALTSNEELTPLGRHLAQLPLDVYLGKLLLLSTLYSCVDVCVTIAAILSSKSPWVQPFGKREQAEVARMNWKTGDSDLLTTYYAYSAWRKAVQDRTINEYEFCNKNYLSSKTLAAIEELKVQLFVALADSGLMSLEWEERIALNRARYLRRGRQQFFEVPHRYDSNSKDDDVVCSTIAAGFYPKILAKEHKGWRNIVNNQNLNVALTSVNRKSKTAWLSYYNIFQGSTKHYDAFETSKVNDIALALLCGDAEFKLYAGAMIIDGNRIRFVFDSWRGMIAIRILRRKIRALTFQRWKNLDSPIANENMEWFEIAMRVLSRGKMKILA